MNAFKCLARHTRVQSFAGCFRSNLILPFPSTSPVHRQLSLVRSGALPISSSVNFTRPFLVFVTPRQGRHTFPPKHAEPQISRPPQPDAAFEHVEVQPQDFVNKVFPDPQEPTFIGPLIYAVLFGVATYFAAAAISVKQTDDAAAAIDADRNPFGTLLSYVNVQDAHMPGGRRESQLYAYQQHEQAARIGNLIKKIVGLCNSLGFTKESKEYVARNLTDAAEWYINLSPGKQVVVPTLTVIGTTFIVLNAGFAFGTVPVRKALFKTMMHVPVSRNHAALTLSVLTHIGLFHLAANSYAIWNFDGASLFARRFLENGEGEIRHTSESSLLPHYAAFFLISGTFASLCSHGEARLFFRMVQRRAGTGKAMRTIGLLPSLGSSGAAYALVTNWALTHRNEGTMGLIFLPRSWSMKPLEMLTYVLSAEMLIAVLGLLRGRHLTRVGHVAHLGGALFGWLYYHYGNTAWEAAKAKVYALMYRDRQARRV